LELDGDVWLASRSGHFTSWALVYRVLEPVR